MTGSRRETLLAVAFANVFSSLPSTLITKDSNFLFFPLLICSTTPLADDVKVTPGFFLSRKTGCPF